jgi:hypothetical protein
VDRSTQGLLTLAVALALAGCNCSGQLQPPDGGGQGGGTADAGDPRCMTKAISLGTNVRAASQDSGLGRSIGDVRGFHGQIYFAYGDLEQNTGPIFITSLDPKTMTWTDHTLATAAGPKPTFATHVIERFVPIGDSLYAPAGQPMPTPLGPEVAIGTADHQWSELDFAPNSLHVVDAIERAPGDVLITGSAQLFDAGFTPWVAGGFIWRSVDGGAYEQIFPANGPGYDFSGAFIFGAALNGIAYLDSGGFIYKFNGAGWDYEEDFGEFLRPAAFANQLVFADLGQLFSFDGTTRHNLNFRLFESKSHYQALDYEPLYPFQVTEGHLLAVAYGGDVMMTTDLSTWTCVGQAPADATSITSLDGTIYFGGIEGEVFGFPEPSW